MAEAVIVSAVRTAVGSFGGSLKDISAAKLGAIVIKEAIQRAGIQPADVDEVYMGNVVQAGQGQNVARQAAVNAGIPVEKPAVTINMVCGSGLRAVSLAAQLIRLGDCDVVVAGGTENMSMAPYALPGARWGQRMGNATMVDTMINDALTDAFRQVHMGITAENIAQQRRQVTAVNESFQEVHRGMLTLQRNIVNIDSNVKTVLSANSEIVDSIGHLSAASEETSAGMQVCKQTTDTAFENLGLFSRKVNGAFGELQELKDTTSA